VKVNKEELDILLLSKANKQSVANALQRKANKQDAPQLEKYTQSIDQRLEEMQNYIERQKQGYLDLIQQEIETVRQEQDNISKKTILKDLSKLSQEVVSIQASFGKYSS